MQETKAENVVLWAVGFLVISALTAKGVFKMIDAKKKEFIDKMMPIAKDEQIRTGVHPSVLITQAAHESGWGASGLTVKANNLFGFTGESWEKAGKPVIKLPTKEFINGQWVTVQRPFRAYKSWAESVRDWGDKISKESRYAKAYPFARIGDIRNFGIEVQKAGYATDPKYGEKLASLGQVISAVPGVIV